MPNTWTFHSAGSLLFGRDAVTQLGDVAARLRARRVLIVTDPTLVKVGIAEQATKPLAAAGVTVEVFAGCVPEPPVEVVRQAIEAARAFQPDVLLGLGGGSNMDTAKLAAIVLAHGGDPTDYVGDGRVPGPVFPLICVPTTAGTGSEVSAAAVFTDTANKIKVSCLSNYLRPAAAVVDPLLTVGCPPKVTADSGIDALTHAIEAFTAVDQDEFLRRPGGPSAYQGKNPLADTMAAQSISLVQQFLARAVRDGSDQEARDGMALAATLGGLAFSNAGVALVHAMEYPVGGAVHVSHGAGNGLLLPYVMRYNLSARAAVLAELTGLFSVAYRSAEPEDMAEAVVAAVEKLRAEIGIPTRLRDIGVTEDMLPGFAEKAFAIKRLMRTNPRMPQTADEILAIYREAF
ncbi:MAG TPA: iron-containing alcohol dehydrogenase [Fimbriiglobus sp.]|nr:iron-containing alcohol dehydrogenase [Fimbriiglobus sp.]